MNDLLPLMLRWVLRWLLPPVLGALIGYVTNAIAIKMLFRPLITVRLFGQRGGPRIPFTPGILPKERHKLAESIGRMVEQELLTSEVLKERLQRHDVRRKIGSNIGSYTDQLINRPLSEFLEMKDENFPLVELLNDFVKSEVFNSFLEEIIRNWTVNKTGGILGELLVLPARDIIKSGLIREIKNHANGHTSFYRQALESLVERYPGISLGEFISLGRLKKEKIDFFLAEKTADTLSVNVEGALSSIDVKTLVIDRINSLDMLKVEKIILDIMAGQLKWINFFGAVLGTLIGFTQVIVSLLLFR